jgi:hypothetical protein
MHGRWNTWLEMIEKHSAERTVADLADKKINKKERYVQRHVDQRSWTPSFTCIRVTDCMEIWKQQQAMLAY